MSLRTAALPARGPSILMGRAELTKCRGSIMSRLGTGSDKATSDMVVHLGLGMNRPARLILVLWLTCWVVQVASYLLVGLFLVSTARENS